MVSQNNIATTGRPDEYKGTIAIDHQTAGESIEQLIEPLIEKYTRRGYFFAGVELNISNAYSFTPNNHEIGIVLSRKIGDEEWEYKKVTVETSLTNLLLACTAMEIRLCHRTDFDNDTINWNQLEDITELEED